MAVAKSGDVKDQDDESIPKNIDTSPISRLLPVDSSGWHALQVARNGKVAASTDRSAYVCSCSCSSFISLARAATRRRTSYSWQAPLRLDRSLQHPLSLLHR